MKTKNQKHPFYMSPFSQKDDISHCHLHTEGLEQPSLWHRPSPVTTSSLSLSFSLPSLPVPDSLPSCFSLSLLSSCLSLWMLLMINQGF